MSERLHRSQRSVMNCARPDANARNQLPRERAFHQEFCLLGISLIAPVARLHRIPVNHVQVFEACEIFEVAGSGIRFAKGPAMAIVICPRHRSAQVCLQVDDGLLATAIREFGIVRPVNYIQHDGPWTEVEWYALADIQVRMTGQRQFFKPTLLDVIHSDSRAG